MLTHRCSCNTDFLITTCPVRTLSSRQRIMLGILVGYITSSIVTALLFVKAVPAFKWLKSFLRMYNIASAIPGPTNHLLMWNVLEMLDPTSVFTAGRERYLIFGKLYKFWIGKNLMIMLSGPGDVKYVFNHLKENHRPKLMTEPVKTSVGEGIFTIGDGELFKSHYRLLKPMFYPAMLKNYHVIFENGTKSLHQSLSEKTGGRTIDINEYFSSHTMETICSAMFGSETINRSKDGKEYLEGAKEQNHLLALAIFKPWLLISWIQNFFYYGRRLIYVQKVLHSYINRVLDDKMQAINITKPTAVTSAETDATPTLLDLIVKANESREYKLSRKEIKDEVLTATIGSSVSIATTLSFMCVLLGIHQDVQEEASEELMEVFGSSLREATSDDLSRLVVLERIIKETLRLFPPVTYLPRELREDIRLPSGKILPAGGNVIADIFHIHRDPESYWDPEDFVPERWRPENATLLNPDAYMPFGTGTRKCIGFRYAMLHLKVSASNLLRRFKVTTDYKMADLRNLSFSFTLELCSGYKVQLHKKDIVCK